MGLDGGLYLDPPNLETKVTLEARANIAEQLLSRKAKNEAILIANEIFRRLT